MTLPGTQKLSIKSVVAEQEYELLIHLPGNYNTQTSKTYPVLYLLDAQWDFPLTTGVYGSQYYDGFLPGIIIVGITWGGKDARPERLRFRDFTPPVYKSPMGEGKALEFLKFIKTELIPFIDSKFRTAKNDRVLAGSSLGGLFTLYTMFEEPTLFNRYILTSPALQYGNGVVLEHEKLFAAKKIPLNARLFMAHGELENPGPFEKFAEHMKQRNYAGLEMQTRILDHIGHSGTKAEGYARGLQWVFAKPSLQLSPAVLNAYAGLYQLGNDTLKLVGESGKLVASMGDGNRFVLDAATENDFYLKGEFLNLYFKKDQSGKVSGFQLEQFGGEQFVKKISQ